MRRQLAELAGPRDRDLRGKKKNRRSGEPPFSLDLWKLARLFLAACYCFERLCTIVLRLRKRSELLVLFVCIFDAMN